MDQLTPRRDLHAHVLVRRRVSSNEFLLHDADFRFAAQNERMRVDRNGSVLSLLLITLPVANSDQSSVVFLAKLLEGRLRTTDTPGLLADGRVAVLLPDTPAEGAWKVASDISEIYSPGPSRPECDVRVYPACGRQQEFDKLDNGTLPETVKEGRGSVENGSGDFFFAQSMPAWKRVVDICGSLTGLVFSVPILAVAAVGIRLSSGGADFLQAEARRTCRAKV